MEIAESEKQKNISKEIAMAAKIPAVTDRYMK